MELACAAFVFCFMVAYISYTQFQRCCCSTVYICRIEDCIRKQLISYILN